VPKLATAIAANPVIGRAFDFDFALGAGFHITLNDISCEEYRALKVLRQEKNKYQEEMSRKEPKGRDQ
jgi:hypothetical protein